MNNKKTGFLPVNNLEPFLSIWQTQRLIMAVSKLSWNIYTAILQNNLIQSQPKVEAVLNMNILTLYIQLIEAWEITETTLKWTNMQ